MASVNDMERPGEELPALADGLHPVRRDEADSLVEVWEASVRATHHFLAEADIQFYGPLVRDGLFHLPVLMSAREPSGAIAGFVGVARGKLEALFVHPSWFGRGVGYRLARYAIDECQATTLDVNEQNDRAIGFYRRLGFEVYGRSDLDSTGRPFPLLHMRLAGAPAG